MRRGFLLCPSQVSLQCPCDGTRPLDPPERDWYGWGSSASTVEDGRRRRRARLGTQYIQAGRRTASKRHDSMIGTTHAHEKANQWGPGGRPIRSALALASGRAPGHRWRKCHGLALLEIGSAAAASGAWRGSRPAVGIGDQAGTGRPAGTGPTWTLKRGETVTRTACRSGAHTGAGREGGREGQGVAQRQRAGRGSGGDVPRRCRPAINASCFSSGPGGAAAHADMRLPWVPSSDGAGGGGRNGEPPPLLLPVPGGGWVEGVGVGGAAAAFQATATRQGGGGAHFDAAAAPSPAFIDFLGVGAT
ncbi:hypothetical protein PVAP13_6NG139403 [Panicum virgatum]|uniref:Uncharacterized protein n=1 Tax=Panicum virgatum TaxID=38727 RepID=A0A8T0R038_PANVG|nr:hypothetical protein PVAP13_6NG139403 [Panicum virgatum]